MTQLRYRDLKNSGLKKREQGSDSLKRAIMSSIPYHLFRSALISSRCINIRCVCIRHALYQIYYVNKSPRKWIKESTSQWHLITRVSQTRDNGVVGFVAHRFFHWRSAMQRFSTHLQKKNIHQAGAENLPVLAVPCRN